MTDFSNLKLGALPSPHDDRTLKLATYIAALPAPPASVSYSTGVKSYPMFANDQIGDCAIAAPGHMIETWTKNAQGREASVTTHQVLSAYSAITGYTPSDPSTDQGSDPLAVLRYWRKTGIANHQIEAFAAVNPKNSVQVRQGAWLFGGLYLALQLPITAQTQHVWDVVPNGGPDATAGSWGGHAVDIVDYDASGFTVITWGQRLKMTQRFFETYCVEAWAVLSADWLKENKAPSGFNLTQLESDLRSIVS